MFPDYRHCNVDRKNTAAVKTRWKKLLTILVREFVDERNCPEGYYHLVIQYFRIYLLVTH